jgi:hypothetical protein
VEKLTEQKNKEKILLCTLKGTPVWKKSLKKRKNQIEELPHSDYFQKKKPARPGPTSSSHHRVVLVEDNYFMPT